MQRIVYIALLQFVFLSIKAQIINNLVPNGDFENVDSCFRQLKGLWKVNDWNAAVPNKNCSSDYYNICQLNSPWLPKAPIYNVLGGGSTAILLKTTVPNHKEYIQCKLHSALIAETIYVVEMRIRPIYQAFQTEWGVKRIEVLFSKTKKKASIYNNTTPSFIDTCPSIVFNQSFLDTNQWYHCKKLYKAKGDEMYLTLGTFSNDTLFEFYPIGYTYATQGKQAYYLIDDVMVYKASDTIVRKQPEPILPNVFTPNQDGVNEVYAIENLPENSSLEVFNRWGSLVFTQAPYQNNWPGNAPNGQPLPDGVYFAILSYQDQTGTLQQQKQTVHIFR